MEAPVAGSLTDSHGLDEGIDRDHAVTVRSSGLTAALEAELPTSAN